MTDETTRTKRSAAAEPAPAAPEGSDEIGAVLAEMRDRLDEAARDIERLTTELEERTRALDDLECLADALLGTAAGAVVVVRPDRRVRAVSRAAAELLSLDGSSVGKALSSVLPDEMVAATRDHLQHLGEAPDDGAPPGPGEPVAAGPWTVTVTPLPDGGALLVVEEA